MKKDIHSILSHYKYCPVCGSACFHENSFKSLLCDNCGLELFINPGAAYVAFIFNEQGELLVVRRKEEPAKGTLDLPGGFSDIGETAEEGICREVKEETGLDVISTEYLFTRPNRYHFSGLEIPTLDMFFRCNVRDISVLHANDDAEACLWLPVKDIHPEDFGLDSIRQGVTDFLKNQK